MGPAVTFMLGCLQAQAMRPTCLLTPGLQVPFFLFVVFVVYTLLPFSMQAAITVGVVSTISHLLVFGTFTAPSVGMGLQVSGRPRARVGCVVRAIRN